MNEKKKAPPWRRWNRVLHRDLGYLCVGLTLIYAISGIAVNHVDSWNPSYRKVVEERAFTPFAADTRAAMIDGLSEALALPGPPNESFRPKTDVLELYYDDVTIRADLGAGTARFERTEERFLLTALNKLHLNTLKGSWTYVADVYAALLAALAITGIFVLKGRKGFSGRGKWFVAAGFAVPLIYLLW